MIKLVDYVYLYTILVLTSGCTGSDCSNGSGLSPAITGSIAAALLLILILSTTVAVIQISVIIRRRKKKQHNMVERSR